MRDLIDERDYREKRARSIVKSYNVNYIARPEEELSAVKSKSKDAGEESSSVKLTPLQEDDRWAAVPSSGYGKMREDDPVTEEQIKKILGERQESLSEVLKDASD